MKYLSRRTISRVEVLTTKTKQQNPSIVDAHAQDIIRCMCYNNDIHFMTQISKTHVGIVNSCTGTCVHVHPCAHLHMKHHFTSHGPIVT
jgi:hypothetical protein